ncbi:hypothetical protein [Empedobacter tilapiae]|uniref:hypothetical protein n=1 Tax=Empedobacter tilapiae TaxID=2491114 RepID=UPI0028D4541D|nr:hypothetical protein [Empedobacter tilapiae]
MKIIIKICILLFVLSCTDKAKEDTKQIKDYSTFKKYKIDSHLNEMAIFKKMDKMIEIINVDLKPNDKSKRSTIVILQTNNSLDFSKTYEDSIFSCRTKLINANEIVINIGYKNIETEDGFDIKVVKNDFFIEPYFYLVKEDKKKKKYNTIIKQELTLNKESYQKGDSLYGKSQFLIRQISKENDTIYFRGKGFFRSIVE